MNYVWLAGRTSENLPTLSLDEGPSYDRLKDVLLDTADKKSVSR